MVTGAFDELCEIHKGGKQVRTCGPINWDPDEKSAVFVSIVRQGPTTAYGGPREFSRPAPEWEAFADVKGGTIEPGIAEGTGIAIDTSAGGVKTVHVWTQDVNFAEVQSEGQETS